MPKSLSLKKRQPVSPKKQKPITQYFRSAVTPIERPSICESLNIETEVTISNKRKALTPVHLTKPSNNQSNVRNSVPIEPNKKFKNNYGLCSISKKNIKSPSKTSPKKENCCVSDKNIALVEKCNNDLQNATLNVNSREKTNSDINMLKYRYPLTISDKNIAENSVNKKEKQCDKHGGTDEVEKLCTGNDSQLVIENGSAEFSIKESCSHNQVVKNVLTNSEESKSVKSPKLGVRRRSPRIGKLNTPEKGPLSELSPAKCGAIVKVLDFCENHVEDTLNGLRRSPRIAKLKSPEKGPLSELLLSNCEPIVKMLDFSENNVEDVFDGDWNIDELIEDDIENLDFTTMQRCEVTAVINHPRSLEVKLKKEESKGSCFVEGIWLDTPLYPGEIVSVFASRNESGKYCINNTSGLLVFRPDHLVSSTSVVGGVFCRRKAILQERWRGIDSTNTAMTVGVLIHELVQKALTQKIMTSEQLHIESQKLIKESIQMLYDAGLSEEETSFNIQTYIPHLADFMQVYMGDIKLPATQYKKENWRGHIDKILDIEENLCCPQLGLKGKIDATLQVTVDGKKGAREAIVPLELKSGKASVSTEHRGQLVLYGMMLSLQNNEDLTRAEQQGLLLYLRDRVDIREVNCGFPERRDLIMLRNQLVQYLASGPKDVDPEQLIDIEDASVVLQQKLPEPVNHPTACSKCPYLTLCSLHLWYTDGPSVSDASPLSKLRDEALGHLSPDHIKYFLHWTALIKMEERGQMSMSPLHSLWTDSVEKRVKRGTCSPNLILQSVETLDDRYLHVFKKQIKNDSKTAKGPQEGGFSIVSMDGRPWIAAGVVTVSSESELHILLERNLSLRQNKQTLYHVDTYESYVTTVQNLTNLGVLMEDSDRAERLRKLIIEKVTPEFQNKLPKEIGRIGTKLMRFLNIEQQRAVLKVIAAEHYALLQGLPGTGKTQTISVLIQMLVALKRRVLVTAHTHSAVDTVLRRLPESMKVMRLGSSSRVDTSLHHRCEQHLASDCDSPEKLAKLYDSMEVVGVTCLGANHAMLSRTVFDVCVVDEASQVLQCTVLRPLFSAKRFVLVGDPDQLPPLVRSRAARRMGMEESLFHRLMSEEATSTLQLQYRMNQPLVELANKVAYKDRLKCADQKIAQARLNIDIENITHISELSWSWLRTTCSPETDHAAIFLDMKYNGNTSDNNSEAMINIEEACVVLAIVNALKEGGVRTSNIGVIAPFRDQVALLRRCLSHVKVEVSTVDQFQGRDKSVILYSCTKRQIHKKDRNVKEGEVLNDQRRLAVSVTRAKHKLILIGDSQFLRIYESLKRVIDACHLLQLDKEAIMCTLSKYKSFVIT